MSIHYLENPGVSIGVKSSDASTTPSVLKINNYILSNAEEISTYKNVLGLSQLAEAGLNNISGHLVIPNTISDPNPGGLGTWKIQKSDFNGSALNTSTCVIDETKNLITLTSIANGSGNGNIGTVLRIVGLNENVKYRLSGESRISANTTGAGGRCRVDVSDGNHGDEESQIHSNTTFTSFSVIGTYTSSHSGNTVGTHNFVDFGVETTSSSNPVITENTIITAEFRNVKLDAFVNPPLGNDSPDNYDLATTTNEKYGNYHLDRTYVRGSTKEYVKNV